MLVKQIEDKNKKIQLHHLGRLKLGMQINNPEPKKPIPNWEMEVMFGPIYYDDSFFKEVTHDFYYTYEITKGERRIIEKVSFTEPVRLFNSNTGYERDYALLADLIPRQHPAVTDYYYHSECGETDIPSGNANFYGWQYSKTSFEHLVKREVNNRKYGFLILDGDETNVRHFLPSHLFEPMFKDAPLYVLDVLNLIEYDLFEAVPPGYSEYLKPRLSQRLLESSRT